MGDYDFDSDKFQRQMDNWNRENDNFWRDRGYDHAPKDQYDWNRVLQDTADKHENMRQQNIRQEALDELNSEKSYESGGAAAGWSSAQRQSAPSQIEHPMAMAIFCFVVAAVLGVIIFYLTPEGEADPITGLLLLVGFGAAALSFLLGVIMALLGTMVHMGSYAEKMDEEKRKTTALWSGIFGVIFGVISVYLMFLTQDMKSNDLMNALSLASCLLSPLLLLMCMMTLSQLKSTGKPMPGRSKKIALWSGIFGVILGVIGVYLISTPDIELNDLLCMTTCLPSLVLLFVSMLAASIARGLSKSMEKT